MIVKLTAEEMGKAAEGGVFRVGKNIEAGRPKMPNNCPDDQVWRDAVEGAMAEYAVAKAMGIQWDVGTKGGLDVGEYDVRMTTYPNGHLLLQKWDKPRVNILVSGKFGTYNLLGYLHNDYGMHDRYWRGEIERPCFWIPQKDLIPFTTMQDLEKYKNEPVYRRQCAVRQLLLYFKEMGAPGYSRYLEEKKIDQDLRLEARDQYLKGNRGEPGEWYE